jgi:FKBP-type peptidyl-prolyl cis-trans isomerase
MASSSDKNVQRVIEALRALADHGGSGRAKLAKRLGDSMSAVALKKALEAGVKEGVLIQNKQSFSIKGEAFAIPADVHVVQETLREPPADAGEPCARGDTVNVKYEGRLLDGTVFDSADTFAFQLGGGEVIKGWDVGVLGMRRGQQRRLTVPPKMGYGKRGSPPEIPPDATLVFDITLL